MVGRAGASATAREVSNRAHHSPHPVLQCPVTNAALVADDQSQTANPRAERDVGRLHIEELDCEGTPLGSQSIDHPHWHILEVAERKHIASPRRRQLEDKPFVGQEMGIGTVQKLGNVP